MAPEPVILAPGALQAALRARAAAEPAFRHGGYLAARFALAGGDLATAQAILDGR